MNSRKEHCIGRKKLNRHGWRLVSKKKTGSGIIIRMTMPIIKEEHNHDDRKKNFIYVDIFTFT
ncbi:MAG: hypothetical protein IJF87_03350 [Erysipelotrichaceae bacterium]|nr:hypothetical protein [Erysipelotrichaceae bacterium]